MGREVGKDYPQTYEVPIVPNPAHQNNSFEVDTHVSTLNLKKQIGKENKAALTKCEMNELDKVIHTMMSKGGNMVTKINGKREKAYICQVCGKEGIITQIKNHIETNHVKGISIPCNLCENNFRSRAALKMHNVRQHKQ